MSDNLAAIEFRADLGGRVKAAMAQLASIREVVGGQMSAQAVAAEDGDKFNEHLRKAMMELGQALATVPTPITTDPKWRPPG